MNLRNSSSKSRKLFKPIKPLKSERGKMPEDIILDLNSRTRILEIKYNLIAEKLLLINQNLIDEYRKVDAQIKSTNKDIAEIKNELFEIKESMHNIVKELENFSKKSDLKVLEKYINMLNFMKFVTEDDVKKLI